MTHYLEDAIESAPTGTTGLVVSPWHESEVYGVAADWAQASAPVWEHGRDGWSRGQYQVADWRHLKSEAMEAEIIKALVAGGDGDSEAAEIVASATAFSR